MVRSWIVAGLLMLTSCAAGARETVAGRAEKVAERYRRDPNAPRVEVLPPDRASWSGKFPGDDGATVVEVNY
jgi:hypothetical protein